MSNSASLRAMSDEGLLGASAEAILDSAADEIDRLADKMIVLRKIIDLGEYMRECQKRYFKSRSFTDLDASKKAEAEFDKAVISLSQPELFA